MAIWIVDTSPLIFLGTLERLDLLQQADRKVYIPQAVFNEVFEKQDIAAQRVVMAVQTWLKVQNVTDVTAVELIEADLHQGEAEAIVLARELKAERLVMDDQDARRFATRCGIKTIGTLGILLAAKLRGELSSLCIEIDRLLTAGFRINPTLRAAVLKRAGE